MFPKVANRPATSGVIFINFAPGSGGPQRFSGVIWQNQIRIQTWCALILIWKHINLLVIISHRITPYFFLWPVHQDIDSSTLSWPQECVKSGFLRIRSPSSSASALQHIGVGAETFPASRKCPLHQKVSEAKNVQIGRTNELGHQFLQAFM